MFLACRSSRRGAPFGYGDLPPRVSTSTAGFIEAFDRNQSLQSTMADREELREPLLKINEDLSTRVLEAYTGSLLKLSRIQTSCVISSEQQIVRVIVFAPLS